MFTLKQLADNFLNYNVNKFFLNKSRQRFKKEKRYFLFSGISSDILLLISFYVSLYIFEYIFCWITWVTFRWIVLLFSFCFHCHKTNYVSNDWNNNVYLWLIPRLDLCAPGIIFHKMICKSKNFFARDNFFPSCAQKFLQIDFVLLIRTLYQYMRLGAFLNISFKTQLIKSPNFANW